MRLKISCLRFFCEFSLVLATAAVLISPAWSATFELPALPPLKAESYLLMDYHTGDILLGKNYEKPVEPASITKLMTAYIAYHALESGLINMNDQVLVSERAWRTHGSKTFIEVDTRVSVRDLIAGMVIQSGNDASVALAEHIAGSVETFVGLMNEQADKLGLTQSRFTNVSGLPDNNHYMSALDIAALSRIIISSFPEHYKTYADKYFIPTCLKRHRSARRPRAPSAALRPRLPADSLPIMPKHQGVFIAGTDTGVGKTFIACLLTRLLHQQGTAVQPRKPVETGVEAGAEAGANAEVEAKVEAEARIATVPDNAPCPLSDAQLLCRAVEGTITADQIRPFALPLPISPRTAARLHGQKLHIAQLIRACTVKPREFAIIEGAGGLLSPIAEDGSCADLITALALPSILVADNRVGCINHIALTLEAMQARAIPLLAIVLNQRTADPHDSTPEIQELTPRPIITVRRRRRPFTLKGNLQLSPHSIQKILHPLPDLLP